MKRISNRLFKALRVALASLAIVGGLLGIGAAALWQRSYSQEDFLGWSAPDQFNGMLSTRGLIRLEHGDFNHWESGWKRSTSPASMAGLRKEIASRDRRGGFLRDLGIAYAHVSYRDDGTQNRWAVYLPHWLAMLLMFMPGAVWVLVRRRRKRFGPGQCRYCGYDLRATPLRCPECGRPTG